MDRKGQVALVAIAFANVVMELRKAFCVVFARPGGPGIEDRTVGGRRAALRQGLFNRSVEHAQANKRSAASARQQRDKFRLEQIAGLIGEIASQPFACIGCCLCGFQRRQKIPRLMRHYDFSRMVENELTRGLIISENCRGQGHGTRMLQSMAPAIALYGGSSPCNRGNGVPRRKDSGDRKTKAAYGTPPCSEGLPRQRGQVLLAVPAEGNCRANSFSSPAASSLACSIQRSRAIRPSKFMTSSIRLMSAAVHAAIWA